MPRPKGSKNKSKGIIPFEITHEANIIREFSDGSFVTDEMVPIKKYIATARIMGRIYTGQGTTPIEAVQNINPAIKKGMCILTIEGNGRKVEKILPGNRTQQLFGDVSRLTKEIAYKHIGILFPA